MIKIVQQFNLCCYKILHWYKRDYPYKKRVNIFSDLSCYELPFSPKKVPGPFLIIRKAILSLNIRGEHRGLVVEWVQHVLEEHHQEYMSQQYQNASNQERQYHQNEDPKGDPSPRRWQYNLMAHHLPTTFVLTELDNVVL